jgi:hypothetical protein
VGVNTGGLNLLLHIGAVGAIAGERLPIRVTLQTGSEPVRIPALPDESNALVLELFNADGSIRQSATGHDLVRRKGFGSEPIPAESMPEETCPPRETASLELDLLDFFPVIPPGKYELSASIRYAPGRLNATSDRRPFEILLDRCVSLDALSGKVCVPCLYSLSRHESNGQVRTLVQFDAGGKVAGSLGRVQIGGIGPESRLSTANFVSAESIDPDLTRWVAWTDGGKLFLQSLSPETIGPVVNPELGFEVSAIAGRPVVQADGNVTLFLAGGDILHRGLFGPTSALIGMEEIVDAPSLPAPSELLISGQKDFRLAFGAAHSMPIRGIGSEVDRIIADSEDFLPLIEGETPASPPRVLAIHLHGAGSSAIVQSAPESLPCLLRMDWVQKPDAPRNVFPTGFPPSILEEDEHIVTASLATSSAVPPGSSQGLLHFVALGTSKGRLLAGNADEELLPIEDADPASRANPVLVSDGVGKIWLFYPSTYHGIARHLLHALPIE